MIQQSTMTRRLMQRISAVLVVFLCLSCANADDYQLPLQQSEPFTLSGPAALEDNWWQALKSDDLSLHIEKALGNNFSLQAAQNRLQAARALARREGSQIYPDLNLVGDARETFTGEEAGRQGEQYSAGLSAAYEVDLWGRIRAQIRGEELRAEAQRFNYQTAALSLTADVALTWLNMVETRQQIHVIEAQIETNEKALSILQARFGFGQARSEDILRQKLLIEEAREEKLRLEGRLQTIRHQLAILQGIAPQHYMAKNNQEEALRPLPRLPLLPETGLPAELVQRRPDIRAAYLSIEAADADLAAAIRDQYPQLNLSASYLSEADKASNLFSDWLGMIAAGLVAPVFDAGERAAEVGRVEALRNALVNDYGQTVLRAFQEVEDALILEEKQKLRVANFKQRLELAKKTYEQIQLGYYNGANEFIAVLQALDELQSLEREEIEARRLLIEYRVALYRALAGQISMSEGQSFSKDDSMIKEQKS